MMNAPLLMETSMKQTASLLFAIIFALAAFFTVSAQSAESIWLTVSATSFKTGETVVVTVNAVSGTPVQGLTFQILYEPACLQPVSATSPISGMNGMPLPQTPGLVDATFASTTPQIAGGVLAEVRFLTLGGCQANITLESAGLAIRNEQGFAAPLAGIALGEKNITLIVDKELGTSQVAEPISGGTPLPLGPAPASDGGDFSAWGIILASAIVAIVGVGVTIRLLRKTSG